MGLHVSGDCPELDRLVDEACAEIGRELGSLCIPRLACVLLGGGYGRGEGGVWECKVEGKPVAGCRLSNDLDFFAITEEGVPEAETVAAIGAALKPVSEKWTKKLGVDVDFAVKTPWRLKHDEERIMVQELMRGHFDVFGKKGEEIFAGIAKVDASELPWMEAARLMMNRGMGLLLAAEKLQSIADSRNPAADCRLSNVHSFINRNIGKCILGAGDARLVARHAYAWRAERRAKALGDELYSAAVAWKFRPQAEPVCSWERAREAWLEALGEVSAGAGGSRTLRNAVRWLVRRRSVGDLRTFALDPVARVLDSVARCVRERRAPDDALMQDWRIFN